VKGQIVDRWLVNCEYNNEFKYLKEDERIIVRLRLHRAMAQT